MDQIKLKFDFTNLFKIFQKGTQPDINVSLLQKMIDKGYVIVSKHPTADLFIYNYTAKTQYDQVWNGVTLQTRGLILDSNYKIISRPFGKFFNLEEVNPKKIPNLPFKVYEKRDGSFGQLVWVDKKPVIASKGSFTTEQAIRGTEIIHRKYSHTFSKLNKNHTYIFEIHYPENRIVVDYGDLEDLILLAVRDTKTGAEVDLPEKTYKGFPVVQEFKGLNNLFNLSELSKLEEENKEGFVILFENGYRLKVKFAEYVRLNKLLWNLSEVDIWEYLSENKSLDALIDLLPDELYPWVKATSQKLTSQFEQAKKEIEAELWTILDRKQLALEISKSPNKGLLFQRIMNTPRQLEESIWKSIKPERVSPFQAGTENEESDLN